MHVEFETKWVMSIQGYIVEDFFMNFDRKEVIYIYIYIYINSYILQLLLNSIGKDVYPSKAKFYWIWWETGSGQPKPVSLWSSIEFDKKWVTSIQGYILKDFLLNLIGNQVCPIIAIFLKISYWVW